MPRLSIILVAGMSLAFVSGPLFAQTSMSPSPPPVPTPEHNTALERLILQLFDADQALLADLDKAKQDPAFNQRFKAYRTRVQTEQNLFNFGDPALYALWANDPAAPAIVRRAVAFRTNMDAQLRAIVARDGWPRRAVVGDKAAASFFFLFGHGDDDNDWRLTQIPMIDRVFRKDGLSPRLYAHIRDRLLDVAGRPQMFGSVMGPDKAPGTAKLYWPVDDQKTADARRALIGLPSIEADLETFRQGANIGPYMLPMPKGMRWTISDVFLSHS